MSKTNRYKRIDDEPTPGFPMRDDARAARGAFARLAEALEQKDSILNEIDDAQRVAMLSAVLVEITSATASLMPLLRGASYRAQRDANLALDAAKAKCSP